nr:hypothetical protein Itr_chr12CG05220 [Ipomoea trifida]
MEFSARSMYLKEAEHWDFKANVREPLRLAFFNTRFSKFSRLSNEATGIFGGYPVLKWALVKNGSFEG